MASILDTIKRVFGMTSQGEQPNLNWERLQIGLKEGATRNSRLARHLKNSAFDASLT